MDEFQRQGVAIIFLNHTIGSSPEEDLLLQVQGMVAEYERAKILERSRRGKRHAARGGCVNVLSGAPFGYRYISKQEGGGQARYEILPAEAEVVQKIFAWVGRDRCSIGEVCRRLQADGIRTRTGKTTWDRTTVWGMLKNPAYQGVAAFGKTRTGPLRPRLRTQRGKPAQPRRATAHEATPPDEQVPIAVPALVSAELFAAVAEQLAENQRRRRQSHRGAQYLLQGLIVCQQCGYAYYGKPVSRQAAKGKTRHYAYYRCIGTDAYRFGGERLCQNQQVRTDLVETAVWEDVCALLVNPSRVKAEYQRRLNRKKKEAGRASSQVTRLMAQVERSLTRLIDAYEEGLLTKSEFEPRVRAARERLAKLQTEAAAAQDQETEEQQLEAVLGRLEEFAQHVEQRLAEADWATRREIIRALVKEVEIGAEAVRVVYKVPPPPFGDGPLGGRLQDRLGRGVTSPGQCLPALCAGRLVHAGSATVPTRSVLAGTLCRRLCATKAEGTITGTSPRPCCVRDEGRSLGIGLQDRVPNHRKLQGTKVLVVSVSEKAGQELVRYEPSRRTQVNRRGGVESVGTSPKPGAVVSLGHSRGATCLRPRW